MVLLLLACHSPPPPFLAVEPPAGFTHHGIDVSVYQGAIDWPAVAASGEVQFVFAKATEGANHVDRRFARNWRGARDSGLPIGAYHYFSACRTGAEQAAHFLATVPDDDALPAVLDVERDARCNRGERFTDALAEVEVWLDLVEQDRGVRPVLYANDHTMRGSLAHIDADRWVAAYSRAPRTDWLLWQHTDRGRIPGIAGPVDRNVLHGDAPLPW
jgi:lysozyme